MVADYFAAGAYDKAVDLGARLGSQLLISAGFYMQFYDYAQSDFEMTCQFLYYLIDEMEKGGARKEASALKSGLVSILKAGAALDGYDDAEVASSAGSSADTSAGTKKQEDE